MPCADWHDGLLLGDPRLDEEHRELFARANALAALMFARPAAADWQLAKEALVEHAVSHFRHEEQLMATAGYPGLAGHRAQHAELVAQLQRICAAADPLRFSSGDAGARTIGFLRHWLLHHLSLSDRAMMDWLQRAGPAV